MGDFCTCLPWIWVLQTWMESTDNIKWYNSLTLKFLMFFQSWVSFALILRVLCSPSDDDTSAQAPELYRRIMNGYDSNAQWLARIRNGTGHTVCTGMLLNSTMMLTSKWCSGQNFTIEAFPVTTVAATTTTSTKPIRFNYVGTDAIACDNLIAAWKVQVAPTTTKISIVFPKFLLDNGTYTAIGSPVQILGWGRRNGFAPGLYRRASNVQVTLCNYVDSKVVCANDANSYTCDGDMGGPLLRWVNGVPTIVGIVQQGCEPQSVFSKIANITSWLKPLMPQ